jgi:hypothetical protein
MEGPKTEPGWTTPRAGEDAVDNAAEDDDDEVDECSAVAVLRPC